MMLLCIFTLNYFDTHNHIYTHTYIYIYIYLFILHTVKIVAFFIITLLIFSYALYYSSIWHFCCIICSNRHNRMMCLCLVDQWNNLAMERAIEVQAVSLSTQFCLQLIMQIILLSLEVNEKKWTLIAIKDTVSQWSHIWRRWY
jgi:hypothetical protein